MFYILCNNHHIRLLLNFGFHVVKEDHAYIVERLGKYRKTINCGFHLLNPITDKVARVFALHEQDVVIPPECVQLKDKQIVKSNAVLTLQVRSDFPMQNVSLKFNIFVIEYCSPINIYYCALSKYPPVTI